MSLETTNGSVHGSQPQLYQHGQIIQEFGTLTLLPLALGHDARLLAAHERIITTVRAAIEQTSTSGDIGTNDLFTSDVLRVHEQEVWFLAEHLVETPLVRS